MYLVSGMNGAIAHERLDGRTRITVSLPALGGH